MGGWGGRAAVRFEGWMGSLTWVNEEGLWTLVGIGDMKVEKSYLIVRLHQPAESRT